MAMKPKRPSQERSSARDVNFRRVRDKAKEEAHQRGGGSRKFAFPRDVDFFNPKSGRYSIDIIPYEVNCDNHPDGCERGSLWHRRPYWVHNNIGVEQQSYVCPKSIGERCPICEELVRVRKAGGTKEEIAALTPKQRVLYNVIVIDPPTKGVQLFDMSFHNFTKQLAQEIDIAGDDGQLDRYPCLNNGLTIQVRFGEESMGKTTFAEAKRIDFKERDYNYEESILKDVICLDDLLKVLPYKELKKVFDDMADESAEDEGEDEKRDSKSGSTYRKPKPKQDDDEDESPFADDDEDEEEKPSRRARPRDDDEDIDVEAGDGEEELKPEKPKSKKPKSTRPRDDDDEEDVDDEKPRRKSKVDEDEEEDVRPKKKPVRSRDEDDDDDEDEDEDEDPIPAKQKAKSGSSTVPDKQSKSKSGKHCPGGGIFGKDCNKFTECDSCDNWGECQDEYDALAKRKK